ncbi:epiphycan isoform 2-T2 [Clarias gariepinus]
MSELKHRTIWKSGRQRLMMMMMMPCRLVLGLLVLNMVLASPARYTRQVEPDNYDEDLDNVDVEYYEEMTTDEPEIEISTLTPDEDSETVYGASLEEEEEEDELDKEHGNKNELPIRPSLIPSGSGVPEILIGSHTPGEEELRLTPTEILRISGDSLGSGASGASGISGNVPGAREYPSGEHLGSAGSGGSEDVSFGYISSEGSVDVGSGVSGDFVPEESGDLVSGVSGDFVSEVSGGFISGGSGYFVSGTSGDIISEISGDFVSEVSGGFVSGVSGDIVSGVSEEFVSGVSGDIVSGVSEEFVSGASGDLVSGVIGSHVSVVSAESGSGPSGDLVSRDYLESASGASGDLVSGVFSGSVSGASGDFVPGVPSGSGSEASGDLVPGVSSGSGSEASGDLVPAVSSGSGSEASGDLVPGVSSGSGSEASGDLFPGVSSGSGSEASGDLVPGGSSGSGSEASGDLVPGVSSGSGSEASGDLVPGVSSGSASGASGEFVSAESGSGPSGEFVSAESGSGPSGVPDEEIILIPGDKEIDITVTKGPEETIKDVEIVTEIFSGEPVTPGTPEETELTWEGVTIIPTTINEEEELPPTTQISLEEGTGSTPGSGVPESPEPDVEVVDFDGQGMPTCVLCTCLVGSVYCDDARLLNVPPLPKDTTHFYARFNRITKINKSDFANMNKLKRIDLTSNAISKIEDGAFFGLPALEELVIRENNVAQLPALPATMTLVDASHNHLGRTSIQNEAFKDMTRLLYLYLTDNSLDHIPVPLPESLRSLHLQNNNIQMIHEDTFCKRNDMNYVRMALEDIRLDGNPINLSNTPQAYVCLPRIPVGALI